MMGTGHERSHGNFSWKRNLELQLMMALPMQIPFSPLCPVSKAFSSPHFLHLQSAGCWFFAISHTKEKCFSPAANFCCGEVSHRCINWLGRDL